MVGTLGTPTSRALPASENRKLPDEGRTGKSRHDVSAALRIGLGCRQVTEREKKEETLGTKRGAV